MHTTFRKRLKFQLDAGEPVIHEAVNMFARKSSSGRQRKPAKWLEAFAGEQIEKEAIKLEGGTIEC